MQQRKSIAVWVGTRKGAFVFRTANRKTWRCEGPYFRGWEVNHVVEDPRHPGSVLAAVNSAWFGAHIHASADGGRNWKLAEKGLEVKSVPGAQLNRVWHIEPGPADQPDAVYAGADPGVLFRSEDRGQSWQEVASLTAHATRDRWNAGAGGMCLHSIQCLGQGRLIVAISAAGAFRSSDNGATWTPFNQGVRADFQPQKYPEVGQCVHKLLAHPRNPDLLFQQNHCGVYRGRFSGKRWTDISRGLPSRFGFPLAVPASEPQTAFTVPHESSEYRCNPDGKFRVARTRDGGKSWELLGRGLPQKNAHLAVMRQAMAADSEDDAGVYVGTASGAIFYTRSAGRSWDLLAQHLPPVYSISVAG